MSTWNQSAILKNLSLKFSFQQNNWLPFIQSHVYSVWIISLQMSHRSYIECLNSDIVLSDTLNNQPDNKSEGQTRRTTDFNYLERNRINFHQFWADIYW